MSQISNVLHPIPIPRKRIQDRILEQFASERRVIAADWRIHIAYVQLAHTLGYVLPDLSKLNTLIRRLLETAQIEGIPNVRGVYRVIVPYASSLPAPDECIIQEANPTAVFCHVSAFAYHGLTDEIPRDLHLYHTSTETNRTPLGTAQDDWIDVHEPAKRKPQRLGNRPILWSKTKPEWDFGHMIGYVQALPIYVTNLERTLVDSLRFPDKCGGLTQVLSGWKRSLDDFDLNRLADYVERIGQPLLRQRAGFLLEYLGNIHPKFDEWAAHATRGSSARLAAREPFSSTYSERWSLSVNVPDSLLSLLNS